MTTPVTTQEADLFGRLGRSEGRGFGSIATLGTETTALLAIVILALIARVLFALLVSDSANFEGIYYLRLAENLAAGKGYLGIRENGLQLLYPPLFPGIIAFGTLLFGHAEIVARVINIVLGAALVIPIFLIARLVAPWWIAALAALLAALHPYLIAMSTIVLADTLYLLLLLSGLYLVLSSTSANYALRRAAFAGLCFGLAYLARPEGLIFAVLAALILAFIYRHPWRAGGRMAGMLLVCTGLLALPYIAWLSSSAGQLLIEAKSTDNYRIKSLYMAKVPPAEIFFGLDENLHPTGLSLISNRDAIERFKIRPWTAASFALSTAPQALPEIAKRLLSKRVLGSPVLPGLALIGLIWGLRRRDTWLCHGVLVTLVGGTAIALLMVAEELFPERYFFPFLPPLLIWGAMGIGAIAQGTRRALTVIASRPPALAKAAAMGLAGLCALSVVVPPAFALRDISDLQQSLGDNHAEKELGLWLRDQGGIKHPRLMSTAPTAAYYAGGTLIAFPATTGPRTLQFAQAQQVDFFILPSHGDGGRPYLRDWIEHGIADARVKLVRRFADPHGGELIVYQRTS